MHTWLDAARLVKTASHGKGFVVHCTTALPFVFTEGMEVRFVPPQLDMPRKAVVQSAVETDFGEGTVIFRFAAKAPQLLDMVGQHVLVQRSQISADAFEQPGALLVGFDVVDSAFGELGCVSEVIDNGAQMLMVVTEQPQDDDSGRQILIPLVDEFISDIDADDLRIETSIPANLLTLNQE